MPITHTILPFIEKALKSYYSFEDIKVGKRMCELGDQLIRDEYNKTIIAKEYFEFNGFKHTSIDINGKNGSLVFDLSKPIIDETLINNFDIVTNFGTSEHVENQYECFKNIHNLCKKDGLFIHAVPEIGSWIGHCKYYYSSIFFERLREVCNYEIMSEYVIEVYGNKTNDVCVAMIKNENNNFITKEVFDKITNE